jgi:hypothetical protein
VSWWCEVRPLAAVPTREAVGLGAERAGRRAADRDRRRLAHEDLELLDAAAEVVVNHRRDVTRSQQQKGRPSAARP